MKRRASPSLPSVLLSLGVAACTAPGLGHVTSQEDPPGATESSSTGEGSGTGGVQPTTGVVEPQTTTGEPSGTTTIGSGATGELSTTTGDDPLPPPAIVEHELDPHPLKTPGPIAVTIATEHAAGVRMWVDDHDAVELAVDGVDSFTGEIVIYSALANGDWHKATFVAWRDDLESDALVVPFSVDLPPGGSELFWDGDSAIGKGAVVALAVTPGHDLIELGTYYPQGQARCYLRRRDLGGSWDPEDLVEVKPGVPCSAIDLAVDADGALLVLADKLEDGELRWWLGKLTAWGDTPTNVGSGAVGDVARALAVDPTRTAVCGTRPKLNHVDAASWMFVPGEAGKNLTFDYIPSLDFSHMSETPHDCAFIGNHLVMTGDAEGKHNMDNLVRSRHFLLDIDLASDDPVWTIAPADSGTQSIGQVLTVDNTGRTITGGYFCGDQCDSRGELRMFSANGGQVWLRSLHPSVSAPRAIAWHPAGYLVFVSARATEQDSTSFFSEAWVPLQAEASWSYDHQDAQGLHIATAVAIGPYGQIYAGGRTAGGYPAVAIVSP